MQKAPWDLFLREIFRLVTFKAVFRTFISTEIDTRVRRNRQAMPVYIQTGETADFRSRGNQRFSACWCSAPSPANHSNV